VVLIPPEIYRTSRQNLLELVVQGCGRHQEQAAGSTDRIGNGGASEDVCSAILFVSDHVSRRVALRRGMVPDDLSAVGAAGFHRPVGVEDDLPAPPVDACFMMKFAEKAAIFDGGFASVALVSDVMHVGGRGGPVAAPGPRAVPVAEGDRAADVRRDRVGESDVQG
jgi:hypothetical protein